MLSIPLLFRPRKCLRWATRRATVLYPPPLSRVFSIRRSVGWPGNPVTKELTLKMCHERSRNFCWQNHPNIWTYTVWGVFVWHRGISGGACTKINSRTLIDNFVTPNSAQMPASILVLPVLKNMFPRNLLIFDRELLALLELILVQNQHTWPRF